jgi:large subunit ribosomal protein L4
MKISLYNKKGKTDKKKSLPNEIFDLQINTDLIYQVVTCQQSNRRQNSAHSKDRSEKRGGGKKPWRQKGTGRARHGSRRSPIWRGGGVTFGPKPRDFSFKINKKVRKQALAMAMSARLQEGNLLVLDDITMDAIKTKDFVNIMSILDVDNGLIVVAGQNDNLEKSSRNVNGFKILPAEGLNVYDILLHKKLVLVQPVIESLEKRCLA